MSQSLNGNYCFIIPNHFLNKLATCDMKSHVTISATRHLGGYDVTLDEFKDLASKLKEKQSYL